MNGQLLEYKNGSFLEISLRNEKYSLSSSSVKGEMYSNELILFKVARPNYLNKSYFNF